MRLNTVTRRRRDPGAFARHLGESYACTLDEDAPKNMTNEQMTKEKKGGTTTMNDHASQTSTTRAEDRERPRWARTIHNLGDDLRWALSAWCEFPRPIRRTFAACTTAIGGWAIGADDVIGTIVTTIVE